MPQPNPHPLHLPLTPEEMNLLRRAARIGPGEDLSAWARQVLLDAARQQTAKHPRETAAPPAEKRFASGRPRCGCGASASPIGECDGSCIMRF